MAAEHVQHLSQGVRGQLVIRVGAADQLLDVFGAGRGIAAHRHDLLREYIERKRGEWPRGSAMAHFRASVERNRRLGELLAAAVRQTARARRARRRAARAADALERAAARRYGKYQFPDKVVIVRNRAGHGDVEYEILARNRGLGWNDADCRRHIARLLLNVCIILLVFTPAAE